MDLDQAQDATPEEEAEPQQQEQASDNLYDKLFGDDEDEAEEDAEPVKVQEAARTEEI